jgi:hypothetical protein
MPEVEKAPTKSKADAVQILMREIETLKARGYSIEQIAEVLTENGLDISTPTLKSYIYRSKGKSGKRKAGADGKTKGGSKKADKPVVSKTGFSPTPDSDEL